MKCCVSTDVGTWTNWLTFEPEPDYSPAARTRLLSPITYKHYYVEFCIRKIPRIRILAPASAAWRGFKMVLFTKPSEHLCRRYIRSTEFPSSCDFDLHWNRSLITYAFNKLIAGLVVLLSASLYFRKRGAYWDRLCRDVVGHWLVGWLVVTRVHCGQTVHPRPVVTMEH